MQYPGENRVLVLVSMLLIVILVLTDRHRTRPPTKPLFATIGFCGEAAPPVGGLLQSQQR